MTDQTHVPLAPARRAHVLSALSRDGVVRVSQLTDELGVAPVTLRRDLAQLEGEGLLVRVHGGAVPAPGAMPDGSLRGGRPRANQENGAGGALAGGAVAGGALAYATPAGAAEAAASASSRTGGSLAVLVPSLNYYWPGVVRGMEAEARRRGMRLLLRGASYELQDERPVLERLVRTEDVRGLIVAPNTDTPHAQDVVQWLAECGTPSVLVERDAVRLPGREPVESVTTDHALGAMLAARYVASLGHRRVGLVLSRTSPTSRKIKAGWLSACRELGLSPEEPFEQQLPDRRSPDFSGIVNATLDTAIAAGVTALLVHSDPEAMAFTDLALTRGISVPAELSIIAYDDEVAQLFTPALTAVSPPRTAVGEAAVDLLAKRIADPERPVQRVLLSPRLIVRESTARVRAD